MIKVNLNYSFIKEEELKKYETKIKKIHKIINNKNNLEDDFLGWVHWPKNYDKNEIKKMKIKALYFQKEIKILIVIGIGGSYLGSLAAINMIKGLYYKNNDNIEIIYAGNTLSSTYTKQILKYINNKIFGICVISKSGTTLEPAIAFNIFKNILIKKFGIKIAQKRIVIITDNKNSLLKKISIIEKYDIFTIPNNIGGRYSVLTPVGIFILLIANINIYHIFQGAKLAYKNTSKNDLTNEAYRYATARFILYNKYNYCAEMFISYEIQLQMLLEWLKQLFGESEGKNNKGLLPISCIFSTDLHSLGQFIQEGTKNIFFQTIIKIIVPQLDVCLSKYNINNYDNNNYLPNKTLHEINNFVLIAALKAHFEKAKIPNIILEFSKMNDKMFGYLAYWFMKTCAMSAYLLGVNPFNQPGVEIYKKNVFKLFKK